MDKWKSKIDSVRDWKLKKTSEEEMHELMHKLSKPAGLNSLIQEDTSSSLWTNIKSILIVSLIIALAALVVIGSLLALPLLIVIGVGFGLFVGCRLWMAENKR